MESELAALAKAGAATLVGLMVSDSWMQMKEGFARVFARGGMTDNALQHLETSRAELTAAQAKGDGLAAAAIEAQWRTRLHHLLRSDPAAGEDLRCLLHPPGTGPTGVNGPVYNANSGRVRFGSVIQAGQISGAVFTITPTPYEAHRRTDTEEGQT